MNYKRREYNISMKTQARSAQIVQAIADWNAWLTPEIRKEKYAKMAASPFVFYRGARCVSRRPLRGLFLYWSRFR